MPANVNINGHYSGIKEGKTYETQRVIRINIDHTDNCLSNVSWRDHLITKTKNRPSFPQAVHRLFICVRVFFLEVIFGDFGNFLILGRYRNFLG